MDFPTLEQFLKNKGEPAYRYAQILKLYFTKNPKSWDEFTNLGKTLRSELQTNIPLFIYHLEKLEQSELDGAQKALLSFSDQQSVETVYIPLKDNVNTACVSSQIGCGMNCLFCGTGQMGFNRNLTFPEIVSQIIFWNQQLKNFDKKIDHIVFMGMGEPMLNLDEVIKAIIFLNQKDTLGLSFGRITISTCGIIPKLREFMKANVKGVNLAISLHAPTDQLRTKLMPINKKFPLTDLKQFCIFYAKTRREKIFFEYIMLKDINDSEKNANELAIFIKSIPFAHVNLIPYHPTGEIYQPSPIETILNFQKILKSHGIETFIRKSAGLDISAACGQLKNKI